MASLLTTHFQSLKVAQPQSVYHDMKSILSLHFKNKEIEEKVYKNIITTPARVVNLSWCFGDNISYHQHTLQIMKALSLLDKYYYSVLAIPQIFEGVREHLKRYIANIITRLRVFARMPGQHENIDEGVAIASSILFAER